MLSDNNAFYTVSLELSVYEPCCLIISANQGSYSPLVLEFPCSKSGWRSAKLVYNKIRRALHDDNLEEVSV